MISWTSCLTVPEGHGQIPAARLSYKSKSSWPPISRFVSGRNVIMKAIALRAAIVAALPLFCSVRRRRRRTAGTEERAGRLGNPGLGGPGRLTGRQRPRALRQADGRLAVVEPQDYVAQSLSRYGLQSPTGLIRMMVQQSNCFIVVERGIGMQNMMQERALQESGELRQNSNMGGGQMVSADFVLTPGGGVLGEQCGRRRRRARRLARRQKRQCASARSPAD